MIWEEDKEVQYAIRENVGKEDDSGRQIVSEEEWLERRAYLIDLIEDAPEWITYEDLLE